MANPGTRSRIWSWAACIACALVALAAGQARADDVWRMAGTFNGWNATDAEYQLESAPGRPNVYFIRREFNPGKYTFKFVKNGEWNAGHFGASGVPGGLDTPGSDITLDIPVRGVFRITLFPKAQTWTFEVSSIEHPVVRWQVRGVPTTGRPFVLDLRKSLLPLPQEEYEFTVNDPGRVVRVDRSIDRALWAAVTPYRTGIQKFDIVLKDPQGVEIRQPFEVWVEERYGYHAIFVDAKGNTLPISQNDKTFESSGPHLHRVMFEIDGPTTVRELSVRFGLQEVAAEREIKLAPGKYVLEVNNGTVRRLTQDQAKGGSTLLIPGNWTRFTYTPPSTDVTNDSVYLIGDFNNWAMPGLPGSIEMASCVDGRFTAILDIPEGVHRYAFVINGETVEHDKTNPIEGDHDGQKVSIISAGKQASDLGPVKPNDINADGIRHSPASARDFRAVSPGLGLADLSVQTLAGDVDAASVQYETKHADGSVSRAHAAMRLVSTEAGFDRWSTRVMTGLPTFKYAFEFSDGAFGHITPDYTAVIGPDPLQIPDWAKGAVWYQIFVERFRNGNTKNDPSGDSIYATPWNADWYAPTKEELAAHRARYDIAPDAPLTPPTPYNNLFHVVWDRRYGGDLQGVEEKLDYLQDLGVTAIYLNPVFEAESMHKYDATDYRHIDDNFGTPASAGPTPEAYEPPTSEDVDPSTWTWTPADRYFVDEFLPAVHARGMHVILDGVFNHTGRAFFAFQDLLEKGSDSQYAGWYFARFGPDGKLVSWTAWDGPSGWLPKFKQNDDRSLVEPVEDHIFSITRRWMDPNGDGDPSDGIDGWRLDVPLDVGLPFWERWRSVVKSINPDAVIIAEIWDEADQYLRGKHFDTHMNYPFAKAVTEWLSVKPGMTSQELSTRLSASFADAPQTDLIHQNLFSSHDSDRYVSKLMNPSREYDSDNRIQDGGANLRYKEAKPSDAIYKLSEVGLAIQATYQGAPMVYYGDEVGVWGADDPSDRKPFPWPDTGPNLNADDNPVPGVHDEYRKWLRLREDPVMGPVLRYGSCTHIDTGAAGVFAFVRSLNGTDVYVVANRDDVPFDATRLLPPAQPNTMVPGVSASYWVVSAE